jgi:hypothetical protein
VEEPNGYDIPHGYATPPVTNTTMSGRKISGATRDVPSLNGTQKILVLRARSKLERDEWCWALNIEMERLVRLHHVREAVVRQQGNVLPLS